jgi:hypothetical protein
MFARIMSEDKLQSECYLWFHNTYPELRGLLCYNLNNSMNRIRGMMDKSMGLQPGRSDMVFYYQGRAVMIEFKTLDGRQSKVQMEWQQKIQQAGFYYYIIRSLEEFQQLTLHIIK